MRENAKSLLPDVPRCVMIIHVEAPGEGSFSPERQEGFILLRGRRRASGRGKNGSMVKRLRHRPFTAVTRVRFPLESLF